MAKTALITGATSGIGAACARKFAGAGYRVIITGRREGQLAVMAEELERNYGVEGTVRPVLAMYNTPEEIDLLAEALTRLVG